MNKELTTSAESEDLGKRMASRIIKDWGYSLSANLNAPECPCGKPVTGDYGICSDPKCK